MIKDMFSLIKRRLLFSIFGYCAITIVIIFVTGAAVFASPFGVGKFGEDVPFGGETSLTIATDGNVNIPIIPTDSGTLATGSSVATVTSTDVVGYKLYIRAQTDTNLVNGGSQVPASSNVSPAALAVNTWGYNTDASSNFAGITLTDLLIRDRTGPYKNGDATTVTYGVKIDNSKPAGNYSSVVTYTAVPQTQ